ncbi:phosphatidic acid phosphatase type 2/haloperoxidase [Schizothecium vesticola]|uniref:Phosphatidic acid phosphatase type 2/haloperoxidase n=1 Tax=Schizothecium vesticola TaxID=314040 RepID=A0AA40ELF1_9PEZI|nr:phosphatidic acid phosphatase type 2/haloperoxidase [Schizothecium vesticola]
MLSSFRRTPRRETRPVSGEKWAEPTTSNRRGGLVRFVINWLKISWRDLLAMAVLGAASQAVSLGQIYKAPLASTRTFPITFAASGDIVYPEFSYPRRGWIISPALSGVLACLVPIAVILLAQIRIRSFWDANNAIIGVVYSLILSTLFQVIIKMLIGGFRPYFLEVCQPDIALAAANNITQLNGVGFRQIMYTVDVCTNPDKGALKTAMTSFPSGHATSAFAGFVFLFLWMNAKLKVWSNHRTSFYWLALIMAPLLGAVLLAGALSIHQDHHWYDILVGSVIGSVMAFASYRICYAAIFDWRYNHIPLRRDRVFEYASELASDRMERAVFVRKLGWGRRRRPGVAAAPAWEDGPARLSGSRARTDAQAPVYPDAAVPRGHHHDRRPDDMV